MYPGLSDTDCRVAEFRSRELGAEARRRRPAGHPCPTPSSPDRGGRSVAVGAGGRRLPLVAGRGRLAPASPGAPSIPVRFAKEARMRKLLITLALALVLAGLVAAAARPGTVAQEEAPFAGATVEFLDSGEPAAAPGQTLLFARVTLEPGGYFAAHGHPGAQIWYVTEGAFTTTMLEGTLRITRAAEDGTPVPAEQLGPGDEATLAKGDSAFFDADVVHTVRNAVDETTVFLIPALLTTGEPPVIFAAEHDGDAGHPHDEGTPAS